MRSAPAVSCVHASRDRRRRSPRRASINAARAARTAASAIVGFALSVLGAAPAAAEGRAPIAQSLELAVPQPAAIVPIEGVRHLVYEMHITNLQPVDVALTRIEVVDGGPSPAAIGELRDAALQEALGRPGAAMLADSRVIAAGMRAVLYAWLPLRGGAQPASVSHRIELEVIRPAGREPGVTRGGRAAVRAEPPLVLGPPVRGGRWAAVYGPSVDRGHRRFLYTIDGRTRIPARFAVDWMKIGDDGALTSGDRTALASWHGYGAQVLAVADATVAEAKDDIPDDTLPGAPHAPMPLERASGNYIVLDLGRGRYAHYEHLKPGSVRVAPGVRVRRGDPIGELGNTGSSSAGPHLHFHVADAAASHAAEGLPFVFDSFELLGRFEFPRPGEAAPPIQPIDPGVAARRRRELPAPSAVVRF